MSLRIKNKKNNQRFFTTLQEHTNETLLTGSTYRFKIKGTDIDELLIDHSLYPEKYNIFYIDTDLILKGWYIYEIYLNNQLLETGQIYIYTSDSTENEPIDTEYNNDNDDEYYYKK